MIDVQGAPSSAARRRREQRVSEVSRVSSGSTRTTGSAGDEMAVRLRGLTKDFGSVRAVDQLSLEIRRGETVALLGPNGAGKTTTVAMLLGLLAPDSGSASVLGMPSAAAIQSARVGAMLQEGSLM